MNGTVHAAACIVAGIVAAGTPQLARAQALSRTAPPIQAESELYAGGTTVLAIGISTYADPAWPPLRAHDDARAVAKLFGDRGVADVSVVEPEPRTRQDLIDVLERLRARLQSAAAARADTGRRQRLIVYYAGHGSGEDGGYLVPARAAAPGDAARFMGDAMPVGEFLAKLAALPTDDVLVVLDACFSGLGLEALPRDAYPAPAGAGDRVMQVVTAGTSRQTAADDGEFARLLGLGLQGAADLNVDGWVSGTELGMYLRLRMTESTGGRQTPTFGNVLSATHGDRRRGEVWFASAQRIGARAARGGGGARTDDAAAFRDCADCPALRVVGGLGAADGGYVAMSRTEITYDEYDACFRAGGCEHYPHAPDGRRGQHPVTHVNAHDAVAYTRWLSCTTGLRYRLPADREWMRAAEPERNRRATVFGGARDATARANCHGCGSEWDGRSSAPVASFPANDNGLYDLAGNVWEWVDADAGADAGRATPGGQRRVRGGAYSTRRAVVETLPAGSLPADAREDNVGFRVLRELDGTVAACSPGLAMSAGEGASRTRR